MAPVLQSITISQYRQGICYTVTLLLASLAASLEVIRLTDHGTPA